VREITGSDENRYRLQQAFFPPEREAPIFVTVTYYYEEAPENTTYWFWAVSTYYIYIPITVLQYISLYFIEPAARSSSLVITLSEECLGTDDDMMQLLTQRVSSLI